MIYLAGCILAFLGFLASLFVYGDSFFSAGFAGLTNILLAGVALLFALALVLSIPLFSLLQLKRRFQPSDSATVHPFWFPIPYHWKFVADCAGFFALANMVLFYAHLFGTATSMFMSISGTAYLLLTLAFWYHAPAEQREKWKTIFSRRETL